MSGLRPSYTFDDGVCFQVIDDLRRRQFGPPTDWEIFQVTCQGPCFSNYHRVKAVYEEAGCTCSQFEEYDAFLTLVEWERHVPTCLKYNTDHLCKVRRCVNQQLACSILARIEELTSLLLGCPSAPPNLQGPAPLVQAWVPRVRLGGRT